MRDGKHLSYKTSQKTHLAEGTAKCWELMHQIMSISDAHDLHQRVISTNNDNHQKPLLSTFLSENLKTLKTINIKEEQNHFNFCVK